MINDCVKFNDNRKFCVGDSVYVLGLGNNFERLPGKVVGFGENRGATTVKVEIDHPEKIRPWERWELKVGGYFDRVLQHGAFGGELEHA